MKLTINNFISILLVSVVLGLLVGVSGATWCDSDYAKRIDINVNNTAGSALTDYQVFINLSTNPINETSLRIYNSSDCTLRPHWCENITNGNCTKLWIKYSAIAASAWTNNTAIYYDNAIASSASNGVNTFELFDDFDDSSTITTDITTKNTIYDTTDYAMCPYIIKLHDTTLFAVFCEGDAHGCPNNHDVKWINSTDNGSTWSSPITITTHPDASTDARNAGCLEFNDSGTWTILAYYNIQTATPTVYARCKKSTDGGQTWGSEINISTNTYRGIWGTGIEMSNGSLMVPTYKDAGTGQGAFASISDDSGDTWTEYTIGTTATSETSVIEKLTNGHILAVSRDYPNGAFYKAVSTDYGVTWGSQTDMGIATVDAPSALLRLSDGDLLMSWERTNSDFRVMRSSDEGDTWNEDGSYSIYYDVSMPANAGYPSSAQINSTHVYSAFYIQYGTGHADIHGNYVDISKIWCKTGTPTLTYTNSILRINYSDNTDHRLASTKSFSALHVMESRSKINWTGANYANFGFGLFEYPIVAGVDFAVIGQESSANSNSFMQNANGTDRGYTTGVNMDSYFANKIKWKSDEIKYIYTNGTITHTTYIPTASLPIIIGGHGYSSGAFDMYFDWLFVRKYASPEPSATLGSEEQQGADTSFTVTLPSGYTYLKFEPSNSTATNVTPNGQTDSQEFYNVTNTGSVSLDIRLKLNETVTNILLKADNDNNPAGAKEVNTTLVTIYPNLATSNSADIWLWSDFSHTVEQNTNKTINVNVTQST